MRMKNALENFIMSSIDFIMTLRPLPSFKIDQLKNCRIVAHRGAHETLNPLKKAPRENTMEAFRLAKEIGVGAIEFDVRWTKDNVPIIHHDEDTRRVFPKESNPSGVKIYQTTFIELRRDYPEIPTLKEVIDEFKNDMHLMIELKADANHLSNEKAKILSETLSGLLPIKDYHVICLDIDFLLSCKEIDKNARIPIAEMNFNAVCKKTLNHELGGIMGHYLLLNQSMIDHFHSQKKSIGTGFADSPNVLLRELNRKVDWVFTNHPSQLLNFIHQYRA